MSIHSPATILYVDDSEANRNSFGWIFRRAGFEVKEAASGTEALRLAAEKPDLVVLDVNLPRYQWLRGLPPDQDPPGDLFHSGVAPDRLLYPERRPGSRI